jgi:CRISPR-associated protein Csd1
MILQQLYADADAIFKQTGQDEALPSMYTWKRIRWEIRLHSDGSPPQFVRLTGEGKGGERGLDRVVPDCKRSVGIRPILGADKTTYTLGVKIADAKRDTGRDAAKDAERTVAEHSAFKALIKECVEKTSSPILSPVAAFLDAWDAENPSPPLPPELTRDDLFEFRVDGQRVVDDPLVQAFWASYGREDDADSSSKNKTPAESRSQCLVSGVMGPVEEMMPVSVKGIPGGQPAGMQIVSANASAFESYGLKRAQTSPISRDAGERFGKALNALIASSNHRRSTGSIVYVFWSRAGKIKLFAFANEFEDVASISDLLSAIWRGDGSDPVTDDARFHLFGLSPNAARVVVRTALDTTIGKVKKQQAEWFTRLEIVGGDGKEGRPLPLRTLAVAPYREFKDIAPNVEDALVRAALNGDLLPEALLRTVVQRCRLDTENRVTYPRAALLKYMITQNWPLEEAERMSQEITGELPPTITPKQSEAYHCGRLFAELEDIQKQAITGINATISDRYFGAASSAPASVFGLLLSGARDHLGKLRRSKEGAYFGAESRLEEILAEIADFPHTLTLREQALFSLGYYHHKAAKRKDIAERSAAKKQSGKLTLDQPDTDTASTTASGDAE